MSVNFNSTGLTKVRLDGVDVEKFRIDGHVVFENEAVLTFVKGTGIDSIKNGNNEEVSSLVVGLNSTLSASGTTLTITDAKTGTVTTLTATVSADTAQYYYAFNSWNLSASTVSGSMTITPDSTATLRYYSITLSAGSNVSSVSASPTQQFAYGTEIHKSGKNLTIGNSPTIYTGTEVDPSYYTEEPNAYNKNVYWDGPTSVTGNTSLTMRADYNARQTTITITNDYPNTNYKGISWSKSSEVNINMPGAKISSYVNSNNNFELGITISSGTVSTWTPTIASDSPWDDPTYSVTPSVSVNEKLSQVGESIAIKALTTSLKSSLTKYAVNQTKQPHSITTVDVTFTMPAGFDFTKDAIFEFITYNTSSLYNYGTFYVSSKNTTKVTSQPAAAIWASIGYKSKDSSANTVTFSARLAGLSDGWTLKNVYQP